MAVAVTHVSESHTGATGHSGSGSFTWNHVTTGDQSIVVMCVTIANASVVTGVTANSVALTPVTSAISNVSSGEPGTINAYFLDGVSQLASCPIIVSRTNNATVCYAFAISFSAANPTGVHGPTVYTTGTLTSTASPSAQSIDDGSPGANSIIVGACYWGQTNAATAVDTNTVVPVTIGIDFGSYTFQGCYEAAANQGARTRGFATGTADDLAEILFAVREYLPLTVTVDAGSALAYGGDSTFGILEPPTVDDIPTAVMTASRMPGHRRG